MRRLPRAITQRSAAWLVCERLANEPLTHYFGRPGPETLNERELRAFEALLLRVPEPGGPGVHFDIEAVRTDQLATFEPPNVPEDVVRFARPCDSAGAIPNAFGSPRHEARGSIGYWLPLAGLALIGAVAPVEREGPGRTGRPSQRLELGAMLRVLVRLIERKPVKVGVSSEACLVLLLWMEGWARKRSGRRGRGRLPTVREVRPWVASGDSVQKLVTKVRWLARARQGEYDPHERERRVI